MTMTNVLEGHVGLYGGGHLLNVRVIALKKATVGWNPVMIDCVPLILETVNIGLRTPLVLVRKIDFLVETSLNDVKLERRMTHLLGSGLYTLGEIN